MNKKLIDEVGTFEKPDQPAVGAQTLFLDGLPVATEGESITGAAPGLSTRHALDIVI